VRRIPEGGGLEPDTGGGFGFYTIVSLTILYSIYCNKGGTRGYNILRNSKRDERRKWGAQTKVGCPNKGGVCKEYH